MNTLTVIFLIFALLVTADKLITVVNIKQVQKNFPEAVKDDPYKVEKNPLAKWFFEKFGLAGGTVIYWFISLGTVFVFYYLFTIPFSPRVALYIVMMLYAFVLMNNFYFLLKYSRLIT